MAGKMRRVVTGNDAGGRAIIAADSLIDSQPGKKGDVHVTSLWMTGGAPPALNGADPLAAQYGIFIKTALQDDWIVFPGRCTEIPWIPGAPGGQWICAVRHIRDAIPDTDNLPAPRFGGS